MKNCGRPFHLAVADKAFCDGLFRLVGGGTGKNAVGGFVREKLLSLIMGWADAFRADSGLKNIKQLYAFPLSTPEARPV